MKIKKYPEFSKDYTAIDGIAKDERPSKEERENMRGGVSYLPSENAIRSDIEKILKMDSIAFDSWYRSRKNSVLGLLNDFEILVTIPDLRYGSEDAKNSLDANAYISGLHESLKRGLEYVEVIKKVRDDQNS